MDPNRRLEGDQLAAADDAIIGKAFRWSLVVFALIAAGIALVLYLVHGAGEQPSQVQEQPVVAPKTPAQRVGTNPPAVRFVDITADAGIDFVHVNGAYGDKFLPETMGGGVAFLDYDNDSDQDLLFVNSRYWRERKPDQLPSPTMVLYRNDGKGWFDDVTAESGLDVSLYGMGVAVGDYDNDGWVDVFITAVGGNRLFNNVNGTFVDVTATSGVAGASDDWSTSSAFVDIDNDGDLDLFVANYVRWTKEIDFEIDFRLTGIGRAYGPPTTFQGSHSYLYRNDGNGKFTDISASSGIAVNNPATGFPMGKALGVAPADMDGDGWMDLFVANDTVQNFFFRNQGDGTLREVGVPWGLAFDRNGAATGAMGTDAGFYRNDGDVGLAVGNFANEMTSFYVSQGDVTQFADEAIVEGLGPSTRLALTFGLFFFDYDLDGRLDLFQANGHLEEDINVVQPSQQYAQPAQLFWNCGEDCATTFIESPASKRRELGGALVGRGAAYADIDGDADLDILVTQVGGRPLLLRNDQDLGHHWLRVKLIGDQVNRDAIGAWIEVTAGGMKQRRQVMPTRSYLSQVELPVTIGLGKAQTIDDLRIIWPDGSTQVINDAPVDSALEIEQRMASNETTKR